MSNFLLIALFLALGLVVRRGGWLPDTAPLTLNQFVIFVSLPAVILLRIPQLELNRDVLLPMLLPWLLIALSATSVLALSSIYRWPRDVTGCLMMVVPLGNTSYLGFPMVKAFYGGDALPYAIMFDQIGNFIGLAVYGSAVIAHYSSTASAPPRLSVPMLIRRIVSFPPFLALLLALTLRSWTYPAPLVVLLSAVAASLIPLTMFIVGLQLSLRVPAALLRPLYCGLGLKLLVMPVTAALICLLLGGGTLSMAGRISIFEAAMPPMVTAGVLAIAANLSPRLASAAVGFGLLLSGLTLPAFYLLMQHLSG